MNSEAMAQDKWMSITRVATDRPARYGKQMANHMSRKVNTEWHEDQGHGSVSFVPGEVEATLEAAADALVMTLTTPDLPRLERYEGVLGYHLVKFGRKDNLTCQWERTGPDGTTSTGSFQEFTEES